MSEKISSNRVIKVGIVTSDSEDTASRLGDMFNTLPPYESHEIPNRSYQCDRYKEYRGEKTDSTPLKVRCVYLDPIYFEIVQPLGEAKSPWHDHLKKYGTSVCFISFYIEGFEHHIDMMNKKGYPLMFKEEKGFERYAYFDTMEKLGFTLEMKERIPKE
jgi:methylmalonyl-CoA/ethylmalonyl-CoA epimerase